MRAASLDGKRRWISQQAKKQACFKRFLDILPICDTQQIPQLLKVSLRMWQKMTFSTLLLLAYGPCKVYQGPSIKLSQT